MVSSSSSEPTELPVWLSCEVQDAGRLQALERENQELRRRLQEALENPSELRSLESEQKNASLHSKVRSESFEPSFPVFSFTPQTKVILGYLKRQHEA